jgi:hypothetical protein
MVTTVGGDDGHAMKPKEKTVHAVAKKPAKVRKKIPRINEWNEISLCGKHERLPKLIQSYSSSTTIEKA